MPSHLLRAGTGALAAIAAVCALALAPTPATAAVVAEPVTYSADDAALSLTPLGTFETGVFDASAAEIVAAHGDRLFVVNAQAGSVSVLDAKVVSGTRELYTIASEGTANSVAVRSDGLGVVAIEAADKVSPGHLVFFDANADAATVLGTVEVGALPDMVAISADGTYAVVANEGEPADDFSSDPEGSVGVVSLPTDLAAPVQADVRTADFHAYEDGALPAEVRVFGPTPHGDDHPVSRNLEPEYVAIDGTTAYVALQEANAYATVDLAAATVTDIRSFGYKDHGVAGQGLDPSDKDGAFEIRTFPGLHGAYMPDGIASYRANDTTYLVTANEGDAREWGDYVEPSRVKDLAEDGYGPVCPDSPLADLTGDADLGRLNVTRELGFNDAAGCYDSLYAFGGRSFSIWTTDGTQVFDSGDAFESITAAAIPEYVNSNHTEANLEGRSDDKGPEPENLVIGEVGGRTYAFVGLERVGGVMVYDITDPAHAAFVTYVNNRDFAADAETNLSGAGDLGPEGLAFLPAEVSPTGMPALAVGNEVSGTTTLFGIEDLNAPTEIQVLTINDFHGRIEQSLGSGEAGAAVLAGAVDAFQAENPNTVLVSAGDNIGASTFTSFISQDDPTIDALSAAGLTVSAVGNHEFDRGFADLRDRVLPRYGDARFGLGANVYERGTTDPALSAYDVQTIDGVRVAFIGTVTPSTATMVSPDGVAELAFGDQLEAANRVAQEIVSADAADVIVLLAHDGNATPDCAALRTEQTDFGKLVRDASADIDAIVSGHTHQPYACEIAGPGGERPVIQAHQYGTTLGKLDIAVDPSTKDLVSIAGSLVPLVVDGAPAYDADPTVQAIVDEAAKTAEAEGAAPVGTISADILRGGEAGSDRGVESTLGNLVADQYLWATSNDSYAGTPAQIGLMNPGGLRDDLRHVGDGTVTYRDVANVQPFANTLVTLSLTGAQLKTILEQQWQPDGSSRPKLHLGISDGFHYTYLPDADRGSHVTSMQLRGTEIEPTDTFTVVTNSFLAAGGDDFTTFAEGANRTDSGQVDLAATVDYFAAHSVVEPAPLGRAEVDEGTRPTPTPTPTESPWATVDVGTGRVAQGEKLAVTVSGLTEGDRITAVLHSDPIDAGTLPVASADGTVSFAIAIPNDFAIGEHTLVVSAEGRPDLRTTVTVTAAGGSLPTTGAEVPWGIALGASFLLAAGLALAMLRRRTR
ncbi:choice-of-anchor I family protein [Microbacterium gorillae]|uniref:choice-of-anchor I family protein n=1 Tax=Microbacterium gorillae TaxID=1231063 RepID=UPI000693E945|nr:choice-of-anchor I family protein [Microbacterium gorillae]